MKRRIILLIIGSTFVLSGCSKGKEEEIPVVAFEDEACDEENVASEDNDDLVVTEEDNEDVISENQTQYVQVENTGFAYYCEDGCEASTHHINLTQISEEENQIIDEDDWFQKLDIMKPEINYSDERYSYSGYGENAFDNRYLTIYDYKDNIKSYELDFCDYNYAPEYKKEDKDFIFQRVAYAKIEDDILYVETAHLTYAESCKQNAFITAIDMKDFHTIWKTAPLTSNAYCFAIYDDFIITGYGFTSEPDNLHVVDRNTGKVVMSYPLKSMAEYIVRKEDTLYVRTYHTNYEFKLSID